jgi:beta-phosphoglucomutase family hydrolase
MQNNRRRAVIWDMDGVIADTADLHYRSWQYAFQKRKVVYTREDFDHNFGRRNDVTIRATLGEAVSQAEIDAVEHDKEDFFRTDARNKLRPFPGVINLLKIIADTGVSSAVASSAPLENIQMILNELGITDCFQATVFGREVKEGKPDPQVFLAAAAKLDVKPQNCIVIEDAVAGVKAAKAAGMRCIAVTNSHPATKLVEADFIVDSLVLVGIDDLDKLFDKKGV